MPAPGCFFGGAGGPRTVNKMPPLPGGGIPTDVPLRTPMKKKFNKDDHSWPSITEDSQESPVQKSNTNDCSQSMDDTLQSPMKKSNTNNCSQFTDDSLQPQFQKLDINDCSQSMDDSLQSPMKTSNTNNCSQFTEDSQESPVPNPNAENLLHSQFQRLSINNSSQSMDDTLQSPFKNLDTDDSSVQEEPQSCEGEGDFVTHMKHLMKFCWHLNDKQQTAVMESFRYKMLLIQGPPGTGKTDTLSAIIWCYVLGGKRVLACAMTDSAVDRLCQSIAKACPSDFHSKTREYRIIRVHSQFVEWKVLLDQFDFHADQLLQAEQELNQLDKAETIREYEAKGSRRQHYHLRDYSMNQAIVKLAIADGDSIDDLTYSKHLQGFLKVLRLKQENQVVTAEQQKTFRLQYRMMVHRVLDESCIVCATCNNAGSEDLIEGYDADVVVIDEAAQAPEIEALIPLALYNPRRRILAGDQLRLGPQLYSHLANEFGEQRRYSYFERLLDLNYPSVLLDESYRPTENMIDLLRMRYPALKRAENAQTHPLTAPMVDFNTWHFSIKSEIIFINVPYGRAGPAPRSTSQFNGAEAIVCARTLQKLIFPEENNSPTFAFEPRDISVLVPYTGMRSAVISELLDACTTQQLQYLNVKAKEVGGDSGLEIATIDSYQGNERPIIIGCMVGSNVVDQDYRKVSSFLRDDGRLTVMVSRAKAGMILLSHGEAMAKAEAYVSGKADNKRKPTSFISKLPSFFQSRDWTTTDETKDTSPLGLEIAIKAAGHQPRMEPQRRQQLDEGVSPELERMVARGRGREARRPGGENRGGRVGKTYVPFTGFGQHHYDGRGRGDRGGRGGRGAPVR